MPLVKRKRAEKLVGGLPDNAEMLRAVAELTSVGFEGGVLRFDKILVLGTRGIIISFLRLFDQIMAN